MKSQTKGSATPTRVAVASITNNNTPPGTSVVPLARMCGFFSWTGRGSTSSLTSVQLQLSRRAGSTGQVRVEVWTQNVNKPGTFVQASQPIDVTTLPATNGATYLLCTFAFAPVVPIPGAHWLVLNWSPNNFSSGVHEVVIGTIDSGDASYWNSSDGVSWGEDPDEYLPYLVALGVVG